MADPVLDIELLQKAPRETLLEVIQFLLKKTALLESRVAELEARLNANSQNSSKPSSTDSPFTKPVKKSSKPHGRPGGKKGTGAHGISSWIRPNSMKYCRNHVPAVAVNSRSVSPITLISTLNCRK